MAEWLWRCVQVNSQYRSGKPRGFDPHSFQYLFAFFFLFYHQSKSYLIRKSLAALHRCFMFSKCNWANVEVSFEIYSQACYTSPAINHCSLSLVGTCSLVLQREIWTQARLADRNATLRFCKSYLYPEYLSGTTLSRLEYDLLKLSPTFSQVVTLILCSLTANRTVLFGGF